VFHGFGHAKFSIFAYLPLKTLLDSKVLKLTQKNNLASLILILNTFTSANGILDVIWILNIPYAVKFVN